MVEETVPIEFNRRIGKDIWLMGFRSERLASSAMPGQFLMLRVGSNSKDPLLRRPFSIHEMSDGNRLTILYKIVGRGTSLFSMLKEDDSISLIGPLGNGFSLPRPEERAILVAGGMGIAPLFFLAQALSRAQKRHMRMLLGFPTSQEVVLADQLKDLGVNLTLATEDGSLGFRGLVTDLFDQAIDQESEVKPIIYACGPRLMIKKIVNKAMMFNLKCFVSMEGFMACGLGICLGCAIKAAQGKEKGYFYVCRDGPVFSAEMIDWEVI
jgi:dihydroorotate dehydrogenase electron transfer subunit